MLVFQVKIVRYNLLQGGGQGPKTGQSTIDDEAVAGANIKQYATLQQFIHISITFIFEHIGPTMAIVISQ